MSEVKPVGVERDKQIAELRGDRQIHEDNKYRYYYKDKPYSTDIATAFELWEEMKGASRYVKLYISDVKKSGIYMFFEGKTEDDDWKITHVGETEADAISGAYEKWRTA